MGAHHPNLALGLNNLALLHYERGAYVEAEALLRRALAIEEEAYGPDDPTLITTLRELRAECCASWAVERGRRAGRAGADARRQLRASIRRRSMARRRRQRAPSDG